MRADSRFARFGAGRGLDSRRRAQQLTVDLICSASGGPCFYMGRDMRASHAGLQITESEWEASIEMTRKALQKKRSAKELLPMAAPLWCRRSKWV
jgi:hemoglobin